MKFGKTFEKALEEDHIPPEWIDHSIQYKPLKKSINKVVHEMEEIGLSKEVIEKGNLHLYYEFEEVGNTLGSRLKLEDDIDETESIKSKKLKLESDQKFFNELYSQYQDLVKFNDEHEDELLSRIQLIAQMIKKLTGGVNKNKNDMYLWREIFNQYFDFKLDLKSHFTSKNLNDFVKHITDLKLLKSFKHTKQNTQYFQTFYELNVELLRFLSFENLNTIAVRKIIKKFDKHTLLKSSRNLTKMISFKKSKLSTSSIEQIISTDIVRIMPQLDDYLCPICFTIAYKPVRLECQHFFCIRCLIKLQRRGENKCPMCREQVVMKATEVNVDEELISFMKQNFPNEVKQKKKINEKEITDETLQTLYGDDKCAIM
jgi:E3 ubiquitin-protein ligase BAH